MVVVDVSTVSDDVLWELASCCRRLTPARVILSASRDALQDVIRRLDALLAILSDTGIAETQPVLVYLQERMSEIHPAARPTH